MGTFLTVFLLMQNFAYMLTLQVSPGIKTSDCRMNMDTIGKGYVLAGGGIIASHGTCPFTPFWTNPIKRIDEESDCRARNEAIPILMTPRESSCKWDVPGHVYALLVEADLRFHVAGFRFHSGIYVSSKGWSGSWILGKRMSDQVAPLRYVRCQWLSRGFVTVRPDVVGFYLTTPSSRFHVHTQYQSHYSTNLLYA